MYLIALFILKNFKQFLEPISVMRMSHFRAQNGPFAQNKNFLVQTIIITLMYLLALFIGQNLKNFYSRSRIMQLNSKSDFFHGAPADRLFPSN